MDDFRVGDLWGREAYDESGRRLGRIEAVGMRGDGVPRRVGVRGDGEASTLRFYALTGARIDGGRLVLAAGSTPASRASSRP